MDCAVSKSSFSFVPEDPFHPSLEFTLDIVAKTPDKFYMNRDHVAFNFKKANFDCLYTTLQVVDWSELEKFSDVNEACRVFYETLYNCFELSVPKLFCRKNYRTFPTWFNTDIINCLRRKSNILKKYRRTKNMHFYEEFKKLRSLSKSLITTAYSQYIGYMENTISKDPKKFWSFVQAKKRNSRIPGVLYHNGNAISNPNDIVNSFAKFFKSVFSDMTLTSDSPSMMTNLNSFITVNEINEHEIIRVLKRSKDTLTAGCDGIPSFLLRDCAHIFSKPLVYIFNLILQTSTFPNIWKIAHVCPVFKTGDITQIQNYRPISILCNFSKVFESIIYDRIFSSVKRFISPSQHGFVEKRSTVTHLACFTQFISDALDRKGQVDVIYMDFKKAFDQIDHHLLLLKLDQYGFSGSLLSLIKSYLANREQRVKYRNYISDSYVATSGVPQVSNLGPLLFLLFINDICGSLSTCAKLLFADDLKIYTEIKSIEDCLTLQNNINAVVKWCNENRLYLNPSKCNVMSYTKKREFLEFVYDISSVTLHRTFIIKDLGVIFDTELAFSEHIRDVTARAIKSYGFIYRNCRDFKNLSVMKTLFFSLVRSKLEYGALIWHPIYKIHIDQLENIQRRFLKFLVFIIDGNYPIRGYDQNLLLNRFGLQSLQFRRICIIIKILYNLINNNIDCSWLLNMLNFAVPRLNSRQAMTFYPIARRTNVADKSPIVLMTTLFNNICKDGDINYDSWRKIVSSLSLV
ncbi:putative RNA-directed DNA polymerase from transposon BS-like Protein [Tribolium castaneum]|uniref:Putative RNA-directed DNA polymerase from transposon BS-like Protein n=1 Tax=Tribolium castaneum TaxID=7070 RepID=D7GXK7_TRICA|nr:putative RNA-directed DNA polymerase from transposon BS-like Protein [Tribolium castaneum]